MPVWVCVPGLAVLLAGLSGLAPRSGAECEFCGDTKRVTCGECWGEWRRVKREVVCGQPDGAGCRGTGYRACGFCKGTGKKTCRQCGGDGRDRKFQHISGRPGFSKHKPVDRPCEACAATIHAGFVDCERCKDGYWCTACRRRFREWIPKCPCQRAQAGVPTPTTIAPQPGVIKCRRCDGRGTEEVVGKCLKCEKGKVACGACVVAELRETSAP